MNMTANPPVVCVGDTVNYSYTWHDVSCYETRAGIFSPTTPGGSCTTNSIWGGGDPNCQLRSNPYGGCTQPQTGSYVVDMPGTWSFVSSIEPNEHQGQGGEANDTVNVQNCILPPWWQVRDADVIANGAITSAIPTGCSLPACNPNFNIDGPGGYPGIPSYIGSYDFNWAAGRGTVSSKGWVADSQTQFKKLYNYAFFESQIPDDVKTALTEISSPSISGSSLASGGTSARGYFWYRFNGNSLGDLTINGDLVVPGSRKIILLVEGGNLLINGRITIQSRGQGFFMTVVGKTQGGARGNIILTPQVAHSTLPSLEGIFLSEGTFSTGTLGPSLDTKLIVRGSVAAYSGISLQRDLVSNNTNPAEFFEYAPDLMLLYPPALASRRIKWKEVAP